ADVIFALGFSGHIAAADALLEVMKDDALAPLAGEAFAAITGACIEKDLALLPDPYDPQQAANDLQEEIGVELPEPDRWAMAAWWKEARPKLDPARRWCRGE